MRSNINLNLKLRLFTAYIFSVVGYGSEAWTYSKVIKEKLHAFEMWCYRRILKISWMERVTNKKVLETIGHQRVLVNEMIKRKMRFAGHIMRGSYGFLARLILEGMTDGKRDRGRQKEHGETMLRNGAGVRALEELNDILRIGIVGESW